MMGKRASLALILCAAAGIMTATAARAQTPSTTTTTTTTTTTDATTAPATPGPTVTLEKYTVTGSNIPTTLTAGEAGALPVVSIGQADIDKSGYSTVADLLQKITVSNGGAVPISNNATGFTPAAASVSIHGLGPEATLVLINGHRVADYPIGAGGQTAFVDLNSIPLAAIDRIEILTSGASAIYGADAVAGVVNIIYKKNFDGAEVNLRYGDTTNKDSHEIIANFVEGAANDTTTITVGANYYSRAAIFQHDRSYSTVPPYLSTNSSPINAQITEAAYDQALGLPAGTLPPGVTNTVFYATPGIYPGSANGNSVSPTGDILPNTTNLGHTPANEYIYSNGRQSVWDFNQTAGSYPQFERHAIFANGEKKLFGTENIKGYFDLSYNHSFSESQLAPLATGTFTTPGSVEYVIPANTPNPDPLPDGRARAAVAGAYNPFNPFNIDITGGTKFRLADFGNRIIDYDTDSFLATAGMKMTDIFGNWNLDFGTRYSQVASHENAKLVSNSRFNQIVNANDPIFDPASSVYIGTTIPYDPFGYAGAPIATNAPSIAYATVYVKDQDTSQLRNPFATFSTSSLFDLPAGGVGLAFGVDYRVESLLANPDAISLLGDDGSGAEDYVDATRKVVAEFAEVEIPVFSPKQSIPGLYSVVITGAARNEDFIEVHQSKVIPEFAIRWNPIDTITIRASYGEGIRQPSLFELYGGTINGLESLTDNRTGTELPETPTISGSNKNLKAENTKSYTAGVVWSPKYAMLDGFTANFDFWRIERQGTVYSNPQNTLDRFFGVAPGGLEPGEKVVLDGAGAVLSVTAPYINVGETIAQGVDMGASYVMSTAIGRFDLSGGGTWFQHFRQSIVPGTPLVEEINTDASGGQGQDGYLRWKEQSNLDWTFKQFNVSITQNYNSGFQDFDGNGNPFEVGGKMTWDGQFTYTFHNEGGLGKYLKYTKLTVGGENLLDRNPPFSSGFGSNAEGYPGFLYDSTGRFLYVQLSKKF